MSGREYCAREDCTEPVEALGRRFCTPHRVEHGQALQAQLSAIIRDIAHGGTEHPGDRP